MKKIFTLAIISIMLIAFGGKEAAAVGPQSSFVDPTPADGATITTTSAEIKVSIQEESTDALDDLTDVTFNWDGTDYSLYDNSLVLMFNFDNVALLGEDYVNGSEVIDVSGSGNNGLLSVTPGIPEWIPDGKYGGAFDFTGNGIDSGQSILVYDSESLNPDSGDFAIVVWILTKDDYDGDVLRKGSTNTASTWYKVEHSTPDNNKLSLNFNTDGTDVTINSTNAYNDYDWHFVVAQRKGNQAELWIDGVKDGSASISGSISNTANLAIGSKDTQDDDFINSALDEVRIYMRSFSGDEIQELYYSNLNKYDIDKWTLYVNQSNLTSGTYTYQVFASDAEVTNSTEQRNLTVEIPYVAQAGPKYVIFFIGDGMGFEQVKAAGMYVHGYAYGDTAWLSFESFPYTGELTTHSANASITDSAAAATALATGVKVDNGVISMAYPGDHSELETLLERFKAQGKSTGLVTTVYVTHATPAGFGAHEPDRNNYSQIANDYLTQTRPNVIYGGASYMGGAAGEEYTVVTNRTEMLAYYDAAPETMLSGQFDPGDMPYEADYDYDTGTIPRLSEMTDAALSILDNDADGFFLMVEGGNIDHACHDNHTPRTVLETVEFANAVQEAIDWAAGRTDTLILVCADHETGGLTVTGNNGQYEYPSVTWSSTGHTAANVPVYAWGVNAELIGGEMDNTDMFGVVTATFSPEASNPSPADSATGVDIDADLGWTAGAGAVSHDVYFGTSTTPAPVQNQSETTYDPGTLVPNTTYYWAIDELDSIGGIAYGAVWSFTTAPLPGQASNPSPTGTEVGVDSDLSWTAGSETISHDVYFGINPTPGVDEFQGNQAGATFNPISMDYLTTYYWRIDEVGPGGVTTGVVWSFTTIVAAPGQASSENPANGATSVAIDADLNWTAGAGATSHDVYFGTTSPGTLQGNQAGTTFEPVSMDYLTTYYWRIDERNAGGTTTGTVWSFTTTLAAPGQASSPSPADTATSVAIDADLSWTAGSDAASHDVYLGTDYHDVISASEISPEFQGNQTGTTYELGLLNPGTPYYWRIDEKNASGTTTGEVWSFTTTTAETAYDAYVSQEPIVTFGEVVGTIQGTIEAGDDLVQEITEVPDGHPLNGSLQVEYVLHTTANRNDITDLTLYLGLTWTGLDAGDPLISEIGIWNGTGWTDITGSIGGSYTPSNPQDYVDAGGDIRVRFADTQAVKKENKDTLTIDLLYADILAGPVNAAPSVGITAPAEGAEFTEGDNITIQADAADSDGGTVTKVEFYQNGSILGEDTTLPYSYTWNSVPSGSYSLTAKATDDGGATTTSAPVNITVTDTTPPAAPSGLVATPGDSQVSLDWDINPESDIAGYNVYRRTEGGSYPSTPINVTLLTASDYVDSSATNGTTYYYVVTAVDLSSNESTTSTEASATPVDAPPSAPTGLVATPGDSQVSLDWDDNAEPDVVGYNVYRSETSGSGYVKISGAVPVSGSSYLDTTVVNDTTYYYVVTAVDSATPTPNESGYSSEVPATPTAQVSDVVTIVRADYRIRQKVFTVQATSSQGGVAVLTVVGYGEMTYNVEENLYTFRQTVATAPGDTVTVESDLGGSDTASVTKK